MRTWMVIYKEKGTTKSKVVLSNDFDDAVYAIWSEFGKCEIKAIFEVAR